MTRAAPPAPPVRSSDRAVRGSVLLAEASRALELAPAEPARARRAAREVLARAARRRAPDIAAARALAERALGQAALLVEDPGAAGVHFTRAIRHAQVAGDGQSEAEARLSRAFVLAQQGRFGPAVTELTRAETSLRGDDRDLGRVHNQRALVAWLRGDDEQAVAWFGRAATHSQRAGDDLGLMRIYSNRAMAHGRLGAHAAAERDLEQAEQFASRLDLPLSVAIIRHNLGWIAAERGDVPAALGRYEEAERRYGEQHEDLGTLLLDRCAVLLGARLVAEAVDAAGRALAAFTAGGVTTSVPEAQLLLAEASLLADDLVTARSQSAAALDAFRRQRRPAWTALARYAALRARLREDSALPGDAWRAALRVAGALESAGLGDQALDARVVAARLALEAGNVPVAKRELAHASTARTRGTVERRTRAWHAEALLRLADGDRPRARRAVRTGLRILEEHRAVLGATDLRAAASAHRVELARLAFRMAREDGDAAAALRWTELSRAGLLRVRGARPPDDPRLAAALAQLRSTLAAIEQAVQAGERIGPLRAAQARLEREIRDRCRTLPADGVDLPAPPPALSELAERLGERALVEYVQDGTQLHAVVFVDGRATVRPLGEVASIGTAVRSLTVQLDRLARGHGDAARQATTLERFRGLAGEVQARVLAPLLGLLGDRPLVLAPDATLRPVPWFALPAVGGRAVTVTPSGTVWFEATGEQHGPDGEVVLVAGPGLPNAQPEVGALAGVYPRARMLAGDSATVAATLAAFDGASLAHVAAHGTFRADNPMFSSLRLADGPLTIYDIEGIQRAPRTVVLAACDTARHTARAGDDLLGLAAAFLSLGTATLIAPLVSLPDAASTRLMLELHRRLRAGQPAGAALADTQRAAVADGGAAAYAAAAGLVCFGAG